jgi:hypothetical protein
MDQAAVMIGTHPVGPKCAQRAGLMPLAQRKSGLVFPAQRRKIEKAPQAQTLDMFEVMA